MTADQMPDELYVFTSQKGERITYHASTDSDTCGTKYTRAAEAQEQKGENDEWFFRWASRAMGQSVTAAEAIGVIFNHPDNPYKDKNPWETNMDKPTPEPQGAEVAEASEFEKYPKLAARIQHMAAHATSYSMHDWHLFLDELNAALIQSATRQKDGRVDALVKALEFYAKDAEKRGYINSEAQQALRAFKGE